MRVCVVYECLLRPEIVGVPTGGHNVVPWECKVPPVPNPIPYLQHSHMSDVYYLNQDRLAAVLLITCINACACCRFVVIR